MGGDTFKDMATEVPKNDDDPVAPDDQAPDAPARLKMEENPAINKREKHHPPPEQLGGLRGLNDHKTETSEEQRAEAVLQGGPDSPTQKLPIVIKPVILRERRL